MRAAAHDIASLAAPSVCAPRRRQLPALRRARLGGALSGMELGSAAGMPCVLEARMRDGFREIVSGWTLISGMEDLTERIERASEWTKANGPLQPDEEATVKMMI